MGWLDEIFCFGWATNKQSNKARSSYIVSQFQFSFSSVGVHRINKVKSARAQQAQCDAGACPVAKHCRLGPDVHQWKKNFFITLHMMIHTNTLYKNSLHSLIICHVSERKKKGHVYFYIYCFHFLFTRVEFLMCTVLWIIVIWPPH